MVIRFNFIGVWFDQQEKIFSGDNTFMQIWIPNLIVGSVLEKPKHLPEKENDRFFQGWRSHHQSIKYIFLDV